MDLKKYLQAALKKARSFISDQAQRLIIASRPVEETALIVIDVQEKFCDPKHGQGTENTDEIAKRIKRLTPEFRKAGISVYVAYTAPDLDHAQFYKFRPGRNDKAQAKQGDSAFENAAFAEELRKDKRKSILLCGFNLNASVKSSALDGRKAGFNVCILSDLTGNDSRQSQHEVRSIVRELKEKSVRICESSQILRDLSHNVKKILP